MAKALCFIYCMRREKKKILAPLAQGRQLCSLSWFCMVLYHGQSPFSLVHHGSAPPQLRQADS